MSCPLSLDLRASWRSPRVLALLAALWVLTLAGIQSVPLEKHESFVLATAQEMKTSGDWLLPRYNEELRLQKPPMNYWATLIVAAADPVNADIQIYHGRIVSLLAVLMMVLLTARTGAKLYGRDAGLLAALFLLGANGILSYSRNARPDMLYAAFCTLQLFAWLDAWQAETPAHQLRSALLGWAAAALATLTKGPQVPAVFLLGVLGFLVAGPDRRRALQILRPFSGATLFCLLVLPWWLLIQQRLKTLGVSIEDSQLSGSLLLQLPSWKELLKGYYVWQPAVQMFPVSLLLIGIVPGLLKKHAAVHSAARLLIVVSLLFLVVFTFGGQYRKHYLLPLLPVFALLLAGHLDLFPALSLNRKGGIALGAVGAAGALGCAGIMIGAGAFGVLALYAALGFLIFRLLRGAPSGAAAEQVPLTKQLLPATAALVILESGFSAYSPADKAQVAEQDFLKRVAAEVPANARLVCWKTSLDTLPYYVRKPVAKVTNRADMDKLLLARQDRQPLFVVLTARELPAFGALFKNRTVPVAPAQSQGKAKLCLCEVLGAQG